MQLICSYRALYRREFTQEEIAMVSSLELGTAEEAKKLVPSLEVCTILKYSLAVLASEASLPNLFMFAFSFLKTKVCPSSFCRDILMKILMRFSVK